MIEDRDETDSAALTMFASRLQTFAVLMAGASVGCGLTLLVYIFGESLLTRSIVVGASIGVGLFVLFILLRTFVVGNTSSAFRMRTSASTESVFVSRLLDVVGISSDDTAKARREVAAAIRSFLVTLSSVWSASVSLGIAVGIAGSVIAMVTAISSVRQVQRIDKQNELISSQIYEARATRISSGYIAQLPSVLESINRERSDYDAPNDWEASRELVARIQSLIDTTEPYVVDPAVDGILERVRQKVIDSTTLGSLGRYLRLRGAEPLHFSPERAQLLKLLVSLNFPFRKLLVPLDLSYADLRGMVLTPREAGPAKPLDLGETILHGANLSSTELANVDLSTVDLSRAILPPSGTLRSAIFRRTPSQQDAPPLPYKWIGGSRLSMAILLNKTESPLVVLPKWRRAGFRLISVGAFWNPQPFVTDNPNYPDFFLFDLESTTTPVMNAIAAFVAQYPTGHVPERECDERQIEGLMYVRDTIWWNKQRKVSPYSVQIVETIEDIISGYGEGLWQCVLAPSDVKRIEPEEDFIEGSIDRMLHNRSLDRVK